MQYEQTGSGPSLYWLTVILTLIGPDGQSNQGRYLLDTGGKTLITRKVVGPNLKNPKSVLFGSGEVIGYPQMGVSIPELGVDNLGVVHGVFKTPFANEIDGILPLVPNKEDPRFSMPVELVEFDFVSRKMYVNHGGLIYNNIPNICQSVGQRRWLYPNRPWIRGDLVLYNNLGEKQRHENVWMMLDTGATVAATFFDRMFGEILACSEDIQLVQMDVVINNETISCPLFETSYWPVCVPDEDGKDRIYNAVVGIQFLNHLRSLSYRIRPHDDQVVDVCIVK